MRYFNTHGLTLLGIFVLTVFLVLYLSHYIVTTSNSIKTKKPNGEK